MSFLAANPAGFSHLSPCPVERANAGPSTRNDGGELRSSCGGHAGSNRTAIAASFFQPMQPMTTLLWSVSAVMYPVLCSVTASGPFRRPAALGLLLRVSPRKPTPASGDPDFRAPSGSRFLPKQVCKSRHKTPRKLLSGPSQKADLRPWEPGPLARLRPV